MLRMAKAENFGDFLVEEDDNCFSECSSGCQSGWTLYLGHTQDASILSHEEEEDDLSMLSDASSGPPLSLNASRMSGGKRKTFEEEKVQQKKQCSVFLEDTASSPLLCISKATGSNSSRMLSCGFSANHFKVSRQEGEEKLVLKKER